MIQRTEKECFKCRAVKPIADFYRHAYMFDGYLNKCKECTKADAKLVRQRRPAHYLAYDRARGSARGERGETYIKKPRAHTLLPGRQAAHAAVQKAIKTGNLVRPAACSECRRECKPEAHHDDHREPLAVMWLCRQCHKKRDWLIWKISQQLLSE